jgi:adenine/guanine phosphoribosyltransferase-like PRPP-binding protein
MESIIQTIGIAVASALGLAVLFVIVRSQWTIWRQERRQEKQHIYNK